MHFRRHFYCSETSKKAFKAYGLKLSSIAGEMRAMRKKMSAANIATSHTMCCLWVNVAAPVTTVTAVSHELTVTAMAGQIIRSQGVYYAISGSSLARVTHTVN